MTAVYDHARMYLDLGFAVLPLHFPHRQNGHPVCSCTRTDCQSPAKHPFGRLVRNGLTDASKNPATVERWFTNSSTNIGIVTGAVSGIFALDVDPRHDGDETLAALEKKHGPLTDTWRFLTGGGGEHILFRHPGGTVPNSAGALGPGLDVRADGGYIVAPPSRHISGRPYAISVDHHPEDITLADAPEWLLARIVRSSRHRRSGGKTTRTDWRAHVGAIHDEGQRNSAVAKLSGHLLRNRIDPMAALDLVRCWNRFHCQPPLADEEVALTVRSIAAREVARRESRHEK